MGQRALQCSLRSRGRCFGGLLEAVLRRLGGRFGASWCLFWASWGRAWGLLGASWGLLGASCGAQDPPRWLQDPPKIAPRPKNGAKPPCAWPCLASLGPACPSLPFLGLAWPCLPLLGHACPYFHKFFFEFLVSWAVLGPFLAVLRLSWAVLGCFWASSGRLVKLPKAFWHLF